MLLRNQNFNFMLIKVEQIRLIYSGKQMSDECKLCDYSVKPGLKKLKNNVQIKIYEERFPTHRNFNVYHKI